MIEYRIDRRSGIATVQQTKQALRLGVLEPGDRLPTAREVVEATAVNPNTVLKAYRELEREGLVEARRGLGTFVRRGLGTAGADSPLRGELTDWALRARAAGLGRDDVAALFTAALDAPSRNTSGTSRPDRTSRSSRPSRSSRTSRYVSPTSRYVSRTSRPGRSASRGTTHE